MICKLNETQKITMKISKFTYGHFSETRRFTHFFIIYCRKEENLLTRYVQSH